MRVLRDVRLRQSESGSAAVGAESAKWSRLGGIKANGNPRAKIGGMGASIVLLNTRVRGSIATTPPHGNVGDGKHTNFAWDSRVPEREWKRVSGLGYVGGAKNMMPGGLDERVTERTHMWPDFVGI